MSEALTYAKVDGPPVDWWNVEVVDTDAGAKVEHVIEVNAAEGWLTRYATDAHGVFCLDGDALKTERVEGRFQLLRRT